MDFETLKYLAKIKENFIERLKETKETCLMSYWVLYDLDKNPEVRKFKALQIAYFDYEIAEAENELRIRQKQMEDAPKNKENNIINLFFNKPEE